MNKRVSEILKKLSDSDRFFGSDEQYKPILQVARSLYEKEDYELCESTLDSLPTNADLLVSLMVALEGKPVHKTLTLIQDGKVDECSFVTLKGLSSLLTHAAISCEQGDLKYQMLLPYIAAKIDEIIYNLQGKS